MNDEKISLGVLLTFQSLLTYFLSPIRELVDLNADTKSMKNAIIRIKELIVEEKQHGYISNVVSGDIMIKNLNYTHSRDFNILNNINIKIKNGEKIMIIGKSGCGKSTLMRLIKGYYSVKRGCIKIGNKDINDYKNLESILYINQTEFLFTDSVYNNIVLNDIVSNQELEEILKICEIHDIIRNNKLGLFLLVEENGFNLSGGERQRIILARTIIKPFNILIIDEGLSQVDVDMERRIIKKLFKKFYDKTIIVISHRLENLDLFDRYIEINKGKVFKDIVRNE